MLHAWRSTLVAGLIAGPFLFGTPLMRASAQMATVSGAIDGVVSDTSLAPIADAVASIIGTQIQVVTGANGRFRILALAPGRHLLLVRRLGFEPISTELRIAPGDTLRLSFLLERMVTTLDTVRVAAKPQVTMRMAEFEERRALGIGQFMTEAEIDKRNSVSIEDLFRSLIATRRRPGGGSPLKSCLHEQWYLDGVLLPPDFKLSWLPSPKELGGLEYYSGPSKIPLQYKSTGQGGFCGVVLIWTK